MSESQLPEDCRSRIQQGFAASLLLTSLLFFWILLASNEPPRGGRGFIWGLGGLSPKHLAAGPLSPNQLATGVLPPSAWATGPPPARLSNFPRGYFAPSPLSPSACATCP